MGYCKPIPSNAQTILDNKTRERLHQMHERGEPVQTLYDLRKGTPWNKSITILADKEIVL